MINKNLKYKPLVFAWLIITLLIVHNVYPVFAVAANAIPTSLPAAPSNLTSSASFYVSAYSAQMYLSWTDNSHGETGFVIERCVTSKSTCTNFRAITSVGPNVESYKDVGLQVGVTYCYHVLTKNGLGNSKPSNISCSKTPWVP